MSSSPAILIAEAGVLLSTVVLTVLVSRLRRTLTTVESAPAIAPPPPPKTAPPRRDGWTRWLSCFSPPRPPRLSHSHIRRPSRAAPIVADLPQASREELVEVATLFAGQLPGWEGPQSTDPWTLAVDADGGALKVYHAQHGPSLLFRVTATADSDFAQTVALFREVDLLSQWNKGVAQAAVEETRGPTELVAHALVNFPWPLPPSLIRLHARLHAGAAAAAAPPSVLLVATSPDGAAPLPPALVSLLEEHDELPIRCAAARLTPRTDGGAPPRTTVDAVVALDLSELLESADVEVSLPSWLLRLLFRVVQPWVWKPAKAILAALGAKEPSRWEPAAAEALRRRLDADADGLYALLGHGGPADEASERGKARWRQLSRERQASAVVDAFRTRGLSDLSVSRGRTLSSAPQWLRSRGTSLARRRSFFSCASWLRWLRCMPPPPRLPPGVAHAHAQHASARRVTFV